MYAAQMMTAINSQESSLLALTQFSALAWWSHCIFLFSLLWLQSKNNIYLFYRPH